MSPCNDWASCQWNKPLTCHLTVESSTKPKILYRAKENNYIADTKVVLSLSGTIIFITSSFTITSLFLAYQSAKRAHFRFHFHWDKWKQLYLNSACQELPRDFTPFHGKPSQNSQKHEFSGHAQALWVIWTTRNRWSVWQGERGESQAQDSSK